MVIHKPLVLLRQRRLRLLLRQAVPRRPPVRQKRHLHQARQKRRRPLKRVERLKLRAHRKPRLHHLHRVLLGLRRLRHPPKQGELPRPRAHRKPPRHRPLQGHLKHRPLQALRRHPRRLEQPLPVPPVNLELRNLVRQGSQGNPANRAQAHQASRAQKLQLRINPVGRKRRAIRNQALARPEKARPAKTLPKSPGRRTRRSSVNRS
ncbi:hypothetical protein HMPREF1861_00176 [Corynebacterium kroppenstedtii]|nr:hypothetical protein HMPREF1861_00176 [Corynebacterium kroppenstedtii]